MAVSDANVGLTDEVAYRAQLFEQMYTFKRQSHKLLAKVDGELDGQPFDLEQIDHCQVLLLDHTAQVQCTQMIDSQLLIGPCSGSVVLEGCRDCEMSVACKNLRLRDCRRCVLYVHAAVGITVEGSADLSFARFNGQPTLPRLRPVPTQTRSPTHPSRPSSSLSSAPLAVR